MAKVLGISWYLSLVIVQMCGSVSIMFLKNNGAIESAVKPCQILNFDYCSVSLLQHWEFRCQNLRISSVNSEF